MTDPYRNIAAAALLAAAAGWMALGAGLFIDPARAWLAYLVAYAYALTIALGALCLVMIAHATAARWFVAVRRPAETIAATLPLLALLFLPLLAGLHALYPWVAPRPAGLEPRVVEVLDRTSAYLNVPFFVARAVFYQAVWSGLALYLRRWSLRQDLDPAASPRRRAAAVSSVGLVLFGFTFTFAAFDWLMSLTPAWKSTAFGIYVFAGAMIGGLAATVLLVRHLERSGALTGYVAAAHRHALGRLLLTFVCFWAYIFYAQGFIVWIANLPSEVTWYLARWAGGWRLVCVLLLAGHFFLPFLALLSRRWKRSAAALAAVSAWLLAMHYLDLYWLVVPSLGGARAHWLDAAALAAILGPTLAYGGWLFGGQAPVPRGDPLLEASLAYESR